MKTYFEVMFICHFGLTCSLHLTVAIFNFSYSSFAQTARNVNEQTRNTHMYLVGRNLFDVTYASKSVCCYFGPQSPAHSVTFLLIALRSSVQLAFIQHKRGN